MINKNVKIGQFTNLIRTKIKLPKEESIYLYIRNKKKTRLINNDEIILNVYQKHKHIDNFLYLIYDTEKIFG